MPDASRESELDVLDVRDRLIEEMRDVVVIEVVDNAAALAAADHEPKMAKQPQLVGNRGGFHPHCHRELVHARGARSEPTENPHPAGRRERLHCVRDHTSEIEIESIGAAEPSMSHPPTISA